MNQQPELTPKVVLGVGAHPDDLDFIAGGTVAQWVKQGATAYYLVLTNGNKGSATSDDQAAITADRQAEQQAACDALGVKEVFFCDYNDCELQCDNDVRRSIARIIRQVKPDVVLTFDPSMLYSAEHGMINHPDHRAAGQATLDAVYPMARDHLTFPELLKDGLEPHKVKTVLLHNLNDQNYCVDITDVMDAKLKAIQAHFSQFGDKPEITEAVHTIAKKAGKHLDCGYAEAFVRVDIR